MRIGLFSDVHANLEALEVVLPWLRSQDVEALVFGGDLVGYGPNPVECVKICENAGIYGVAGNHDRAVTGEIPYQNFSTDARAVVEWTIKKLTPSDLQYLRSMPSGSVFPGNHFEWIHGGPRDPISEYCDTENALTIAFRHVEAKGLAMPLLFLGHTHKPFLADKTPEGKVMKRAILDGEEIEVGRVPLIINIGSVGQPRDGDPRAACGVLDTDRRLFTFKRLDYPAARTAEKIRAAGLPERLAIRLEKGD